MDELDYLEEQNEQHVTQRHLLHALDHVAEVLRAHGIRHGVMGGMSMILLGNQRRTTSDVDVAVETSTRALLGALATDNRVYLPQANSVAGSGVARIFVLTGPRYGHNVEPLAVEVDLILSGNQGAPRQLEGAVATYTVQTQLGARNYNILAIKVLFRAKLRAYYRRESNKDYQDLVWMCMRQSVAVRRFAPELTDVDVEMQHFARTFADENERDSEQVEWLYELLGFSRRPSSSSSQGSSRSSHRRGQ
ncbi:hypothetical protein C8A05DRAFT_36622 [Staphylotrichum tortipilum]|uniref:Uncharacterized protein n=1 Tax=Staphylotrichum tortipilum TaxID=2831512 RepID=A0AAN6MGG0_9PEZI|nr:hypothetical protein C8A05DRAFT_36622 [Staphylotrichum longicolle]